MNVEILDYPKWPIRLRGQINNLSMAKVNNRNDSIKYTPTTIEEIGNLLNSQPTYEKWGSI